MLYINNIALPEDQQSVFVNNVAAEKVYYNNELVWEYSPYPTCPGYTLYGDYFLSDTVTTNKTWNEACYMTEYVTVTKGSETKTVTAKTLSKTELEILTTEQRKFGKWYWTSTTYGNGYGAWTVYNGGDFSYYYVTYRAGDGGARLGFKNPF